MRCPTWRIATGNVRGAAVLRIAERRGLQSIGRWVHMLGFRGHFVTKVARLLNELGAVRDAALPSAERDEQPAEDEDSTVVVAAWDDVGWTT
jgi:hypothetical protein